jgi:hypothetical protein
MDSFTVLLAQESRRKGPPCTMGRILATVDKPTATQVCAAMDNVAAGNGEWVAIARALTRTGHKVGPTTIRRHHAHECACQHG